MITFLNSGRVPGCQFSQTTSSVVSNVDIGARLYRSESKEETLVWAVGLGLKPKVEGKGEDETSASLRLHF